MAANQMRMERVFVTPPIAAEWLAKNTEWQRRISQFHVRKLAHDMKSGQWLDTHASIAFNGDGTLKDGQHRLQAVIESGCGQWFWVCYNLPSESMAAIDCGMRRSIANAAQLIGLDLNVNDLATATRMLLSFSERAVTANRQQIIEFAGKHYDAIKFSHSGGGSSDNARHASVRATVSRAWYTQDRIRLREFIEVLNACVSNNPEDQAALLLAKFMTAPSNRGIRSGGSTARLELYKRAQAALVAFLNRKQTSRISPLSSEAFPIP